MNLDIASKLNEHLIEITKHANAILFIANNSGDNVLKKKAQLALGNAISELDLNLWELIYAQHPSLRPPDMVAINLPE